MNLGRIYKVWTEEVEKEVNTGLEMQWQQIKIYEKHSN
jgi:hypothetical protein